MSDRISRYGLAFLHRSDSEWLLPVCLRADLFQEPPGADPHAGWCGGRGANPPGCLIRHTNRASNLTVLPAVSDNMNNRRYRHSKTRTHSDTHQQAYFNSVDGDAKGQSNANAKRQAKSHPYRNHVAKTGRRLFWI